MWITQYPQYPVSVLCSLRVPVSSKAGNTSSLHPPGGPTKLITQAPGVKSTDGALDHVCVFVQTSDSGELTRVPRKITISFLRVWECPALPADRRLKIPRSSLHYNQHSPLTLASACFRYHQHTSPHVCFCCSVHVDMPVLLLAIHKPWHKVKHLHCRQSRPEFSDLRQPLTRQLKTLILSLTRTIS